MESDIWSDLWIPVRQKLSSVDFFYNNSKRITNIPKFCAFKDYKKIKSSTKENWIRIISRIIFCIVIFFGSGISCVWHLSVLVDLLPVMVFKFIEIIQFYDFLNFCRIFFFGPKKSLGYSRLELKEQIKITFNLPLRSLKAGRFKELLGFAMSHSILIRGSVRLLCATTPNPSGFSKS